MLAEGPLLDTRSVEFLAERLAAVPGVVAVTLGGSRAVGAAVAGSDWDFGLYYRGGLDPADISALGWPGRVFGPGEWGSIVNGGAWLTVGGARVGMSPRINHVGSCFDDLPEGTVGTVVVNAPSVVRAQFLQHAEADEPTEFLSHLSLQDHLAGWFGLVET